MSADFEFAALLGRSRRKQAEDFDFSTILDNSRRKNDGETRNCGTGRGGFATGNNCAAKALLAHAVNRWIGDPSDLGIHVRDEIMGLPPPSSGTGKKLRDMAAALLHEVETNSKPAPTLYRGDDKPPAANSSALLGWTSDRKVAEVWAKARDGEVYELHGAKGIQLADYAPDSTRESEWVVAHNVPEKRNCGDGAGGFKEGNTCATGGTGSDGDGWKLGWTADESNAIVDDDGAPLVLYHGTSPEAMKAIESGGFKTGIESANSYGLLGNVAVTRSGVFLTDNPAFAKSFGPAVGKFVARAENVADLGDDQQAARFVDQFVATLDGSTESGREMIQAVRATPAGWKLLDGEIGKSFSKWLASENYGAATFKEYTEDADGKEHEGQTYVVFDPKDVSPEGKQESRNCGDGAGGFKEGNTCAKGSDGNDEEHEEEKDPNQEDLPNETANCPAPCDMTAPVKDGDTLIISRDSIDQSIKLFDWKAAQDYTSNIDPEGGEAIAEYTGSGYEEMNGYFRGENDGGSEDPFEEKDPQEAYQDLFTPSPDGHTQPIWDESALDEITTQGPLIVPWEKAELVAENAWDSLQHQTVDDIGEYDPREVYSNTDFVTDNGTVYLANASDKTIATLNATSKEILGYMAKTDFETSKELYDDINEQIEKYGSTAHKYDALSPKHYIGEEEAKQRIVDAWAESGGGPNNIGAKAQLANQAINGIAQRINPDGKLFVTFRGIAGDHARDIGRNAEPGDALKESGILSTSADPRKAFDFTGSNPVMLRIVGKTIAPLEHITTASDEFEVAYPDESSFAVTNVARNVTIKAGSKKLENVTLIDAVEE